MKPAWRSVFRWAGTFGSIFVVSLAMLALSILISQKPDMRSFVENQTPYSQAVFDSEQRLLRLTLAADQQYRLFTPIDDMAPELIEATLLYEDQNFYRHPGVDVPALLRAFWATYISGERRVGASTLTMQVARLRWQLPSHTLTGKLEQIWRALQLSWHFDKYEILEHYFNLAPYGRNIEGIGAASRIYFDKPPAELNLPEVLALVVLPQNPVRRNPTTPAGLSQMSVAQNALFERWLAQHPEHANLRAHVSAPLRVRAPEQLPFHAPHFVEYVKAELGPWQTGAIKTTLDLVRQQQMEKTLTRYLQQRSSEGLHNVAAVLLDHRSMEILALVGSAGFANNAIQGQVNGTIARRSPGSTLKPFVYALALDQGLIHPLTLMKDLPRRFGGFAPENFDQRFTGPLSARAALIQSRNVPAVELASQLTQPDFYHFLQNAGVSLPKPPEHYGLALTLGGAEVSMLELVSLYAALANRGEQKPLRYLTDASDKPEDPHSLFSAEASFMVLDMLRDTPAPEELKLPKLVSARNQIAWKTGTSWAFRDAWAIGISGPYVLAVWLGNFNGEGNPALVGRTAAGPLLFQLYDQLLPEQSWTLEQLITPETLNLKRVSVCGRTGDLASRGCPEIIDTWFVPGVSPIRMTEIYREIPVFITGRNSGLRACQHQPGITRLETHSFWASDFLAIFRMAGLALKSPPDYAENCDLDQTSQQGEPPRLLSPESGLSYVSSNTQAPLQIPLSAAVDPDVSQLYWFINGAFFGSANKDETLLWQAQAGTHQINVVDNAGRSQSQQVKVIWRD